MAIVVVLVSILDIRDSMPRPPQKYVRFVTEVSGRN